MRWILQYYLSEPPGLSAAAKDWQAVHPAISLPGSFALAFLVAPVSSDPSTASTALPLRLLLRLNLWMYLRRLSLSFWGMTCKLLA